MLPILVAAALAALAASLALILSGGATVAVAERPDARDGGEERSVGGDLAALVDRQPDGVEVETVRVRCAPDGDEEV